MQTDYKPLTFAFLQKSDKASPRQLQLDDVGQYTTKIIHILRSDNELANALSRLDVINIPIVMSTSEQLKDLELPQVLQSAVLQLEKININNTKDILYCDISVSVLTSYV